MTVRTTSFLRVRYAESDQMGVAYHGHFFTWFEVGRTDLLRDQGLTYRELEGRGLHLPVIDAQARFLRPAHYDDLLEVHTEVAALSRVKVTFLYQVRRGDTERPLATGSTSHAAVDRQGRVRRFPEDLHRKLA